MCIYMFLCSPLSPSEGLDEEVLFDLEQVGLQDMETNSPSPVVGSKYYPLSWSIILIQKLYAIIQRINVFTSKHKDFFISVI